MKITQVLLRQHLGRMFKYNWFFHSRQTLGETRTDHKLKELDISVIDPEELLNPPKPRIDARPFFEHSTIGYREIKDENHPDWKERPCFKLNTNDLLVMGTDQAQVLTKTLLVKEGLPDKIEGLIKDNSKEVDNIVKRIIQTSNIFDTHQEKLPIKKDPARPAWNFPRDYGLTDIRKSRNLAQSMIQLCELLCGPSIVRKRQLVHNGEVQVPLEKDGDLLMFNMTVDFMVTATKGLTPIEITEDLKDKTIPEIYPLKNVKNITELPVKKNQLIARSLVKSFTTAASCAYQKYGADVKELPEPITIQCVQSNSQAFHFSVFQLNTLNINGTEGPKNFWWSMPEIDLFDTAMYVKGRPVLEGYNPEVFKRILAFYTNE
ncbi:Similar to MRPL37: 39S ribosomal protein L37 [Cotesia congregata]|uniref:Large ribosomal subunit protein mL37 n=1 Tax=Cotesia congregata TaxID=51543 RepID=A0A8J2HKB4_COTCN|nr:Similar to MRPL37: 39S ribosomal protein L37 [Cotesia congregata]